MEVGLTSSGRAGSQRDLKAAIVERVRAKTLAQLQAQQFQSQERERLLALAAEHSRAGSSRTGATAPSYDDDDDGESTKCSALVRRVPVLLLLCASCSIVLALFAKWVPIGVAALLARQQSPPPPVRSVAELLPTSEPPAPEPSPPPLPKQLCSVLYEGDHCKKRRPLPKCMDTTFTGSFTLGNWINGDLGDDQHLSDDVISLMPAEVSSAASWQHA